MLRLHRNGGENVEMCGTPRKTEDWVFRKGRGKEKRKGEPRKSEHVGSYNDSSLQQPAKDVGWPKVGWEKGIKLRPHTHKHTYNEGHYRRRRMRFPWKTPPTHTQTQKQVDILSHRRRRWKTWRDFRLREAVSSKSEEKLSHTHTH